MDLAASATELTGVLVDVESVSGDEAAITDLVEAALRELPGLSVWRRGNVVGARTDLGRPQRVVLAGHLDTVPVAENLPSRLDGDRLYGCGTTDMKSGDAVALRAAHLIGSGQVTPAFDVTWIFYDCEEIAASRNGLRLVVAEQPDLVAGDLAILLEPTVGLIEGGCQGTMRALVRTHGRRAHAARSWLGANAIHAAAPILAVLAAYEARIVDVDGLTYHEGLNAVFISGGVAGNVIPDECVVTVNFRFAPDRDEAGAQAHLESIFGQWDIEIIDSAPAARPGLDAPIAQAFAAAVGGTPAAKLGWTDVARFSGLGIPAVNFGPGDPNLAHTRDEYVEVVRIEAAEVALMRFLTAG
ncbi:MAG: succinyl-diaminopimelate desuccinylase [Pseudonocardiales bacterium]|nr:succinyl-diaminopimelate desuccinylase [Pseudonocardiales bacterium]